MYASYWIVINWNMFCRSNSGGAHLWRTQTSGTRLWALDLRRGRFVRTLRPGNGQPRTGPAKCACSRRWIPYLHQLPGCRRHRSCWQGCVCWCTNWMDFLGGWKIIRICPLFNVAVSWSFVQTRSSDNDNNGYLERLIRTGPKRLQILETYIYISNIQYTHSLSL